MIITSIKPQKKNKERFSVFVEGKYAFAVSAIDLLKHGLKEDQTISSEKIQDLIKEGEFSLVFDQGLKFLSFRPRSEQEVKDYLKKKEVGEETQKIVLEKLKSLNFIDDRAFAQWWIGQRSGGRPRGKRVLAMELREKGIDKDLSVELLAISREPSAESLLAERVAQKALAKWPNLPSFELRKKLYEVLSRRGFAYEIIESTVAKTLKKE